VHSVHSVLSVCRHCVSTGSGGHCRP
jgi:hypothetical protein